jgi:DNA-binding transcriptional regulator YiaG
MITAIDAERVWSRIDNSAGPEACWPWIGPDNGSGRGRLSIGGRMRYAYRVAWEIVNGDIPVGMCACHRCDNPICCNPAHIFVGTQRDNMADAAEKGRTRNRPRFGEDHHFVTVPDDKVVEARRLYAEGLYQREIGERLGVSQTTVSNWLRGRVRKAPGGPIKVEPGRHVRRRSQCGTRAGYIWHMRNDRSPCEPCREAQRAYARVWKATA